MRTIRLILLVSVAAFAIAISVPVQAAAVGRPHGDELTSREGEGVLYYCLADDYPLGEVFEVVRIPPDDPDGGLNLRARPFADAEPKATLPEGTVVNWHDECAIRPDGARWWRVGTEDQSGWVNSAWLRPFPQASYPPEVVERLDGAAAAVDAALDALAAEDWSAAVELFVQPSRMGDEPWIRPGSYLAPDNGPDPAALLATYCQDWVCDAPHEVLDARPTGMTDRRPTTVVVDVSLTIEGRAVVRPFRVYFAEVDDVDDGGRPPKPVVADLPGRSPEARRQPMPLSAELSGSQPNLVASGFYDAVDEIRAALLAESGPGIPLEYVPTDGVDLHIAPNRDPSRNNGRVPVTADLLTDCRSQRILYGFQDGTGYPILSTVEEHLATYRSELALLQPDSAVIGHRAAFSNDAYLIPEFYPDAITIDFYNAGLNAAYDWSSLMFVMEQSNGGWKLAALVRGQWAI